MFWLDRYHIDGLRVDAVASMLYLDYARKQGEWIPNEHGGRENLEAVHFLRQLNDAVVPRRIPDVQTIAEESTAWPRCRARRRDGGLGFGLKWNMGWMHDTLAYFRRDPDPPHASTTTSSRFSLWYAFNENFVLPLSHDEVVHGKGSLVARCRATTGSSFANLRLLYRLHVGASRQEAAVHGRRVRPVARVEPRHEPRLAPAAQAAARAACRHGCATSTALLARTPALHAPTSRRRASSGSTAATQTNSVDRVPAPCARRRRAGARRVQLHAGARYGYRLGVPRAGHWREVLNSDAPVYGGSGVGNLGGVDDRRRRRRTGSRNRFALTLPPLGVLFFEP